MLASEDGLSPMGLVIICLIFIYREGAIGIHCDRYLVICRNFVGYRVKIEG
jgi:hypothetical protein